MSNNDLHALFDTIEQQQAEIERLQSWVTDLLRVQLSSRNGWEKRICDLVEEVVRAEAKIDLLRSLLSAACDSEQHFWDSLRRAYPDMEPEYEDWYEQARREVGDGDIQT